MFAPRYFAVRFYAPRYFPPGAGIVVAPPKQGQGIYFLKTTGRLMNN